jgi:tryptophan synthase alpha chain
VTGRYQARFDRLSARDELALVPFLVLGDPDPATSLDLIRTLAASGADALELGMPFSDPVADGPVIQAGAARALAGGATRARCWEIVGRIRREFPDLPIGLLVYANLIMGRSGRGFFPSARDAGVDSLLVADLPLLESRPVHQAALAHGINPVLIAPPNAVAGRLQAIARESRPFVYVTSRPGVTGADRELHLESARIIAALRQAGSAPPLLGFGIAEPAHVRRARALGAAGAISGSAVVRRIADHAGQPDRMRSEIARFVRDMKAATLPSPEPAA